MCDDGGDIILCTLCNAACCFNVPKDEGFSDQSEEESNGDACITLPTQYRAETQRVFLCPKCISDNPERGIDVSL